MSHVTIRRCLHEPQQTQLKTSETDVLRSVLQSFSRPARVTLIKFSFRGGTEWDARAPVKQREVTLNNPWHTTSLTIDYITAHTHISEGSETTSCGLKIWCPAVRRRFTLSHAHSWLINSSHTLQHRWLVSCNSTYPRGFIPLIPQFYINYGTTRRDNTNLRIVESWCNTNIFTNFTPFKRI